jgi:hypothetical protein
MISETIKQCNALCSFHNSGKLPDLRSLALPGGSG